MPALPLEPRLEIDALEVGLAHDRIEATGANSVEKLLALAKGSARGVVAGPEEEVVDDRLASARDEESAVFHDGGARDVVAYVSDERRIAPLAGRLQQAWRG